MDASYSESHNFSELHYAGFRAAFLTTLDCLLRDGLTNDFPATDEPAQNGIAEENAVEADEKYHGCGFLDRIPLLSSTAPQVQLECLFRVWHRWNAPSPRFPGIMDQCVIHAAMEWLALLSQHDQHGLLKLVWQGPRPISTSRDCWLYAKIRSLQVLQTTRSGELSSSSRLSHGTAAAKPPFHDTCLFAGSGIMPDDQEFDELLQIVGRWRIRRETISGLDNLLTSDEQSVLAEFLEQHPGLFE